SAATTTKATPPMILPAVSKPGLTNASGAATPENATIAEITTRITLSPTIKPDASSTPNCFVASGRGLRLACLSKNHPTTAPTTITSATCCFHGVASTNWPVLRSCKLLFAIAATLKITAVVKSAKAISDLFASGDTYGLTPNTSSKAAPITTRMPIPDNGLLEEPINPAM